jgi:hypothetical protein
VAVLVILMMFPRAVHKLFPFGADIPQVNGVVNIEVVVLVVGSLRGLGGFS